MPSARYSAFFWSTRAQNRFHNYYKVLKAQTHKPQPTDCARMFTPQKASSRKRARGAAILRFFEVKSALLLQRLWRNSFRFHKSHMIVDRYFKHAATAEKAKAMTFDSFHHFLREAPVTACTKACLQRIHLLCIFRHCSPPPVAGNPDQINVKRFLTAYLFVHHPTHVLETMDDLAHEVVTTATSMLDTFERICHSLRTHKTFDKVPHALTKDFSTLLFAYLRAFNAWKVGGLRICAFL